MDFFSFLVFVLPLKEEVVVCYFDKQNRELVRGVSASSGLFR